MQTETRKEIIRLENVWFDYGGEDFLKNLNLVVFQNDFLGIVGPNGGGKTTLLKLIMGLLKPTKGKITVFGKSPEKGRKQLGYLSQFKEIDFDFPITVEEVVLLGRTDNHFFKKFSTKDRELTDNALQKMGIDKLRKRKLGELSGGEKQRVFVARALVNHPQALVLDEPMNNLDMSIQKEFYYILQKLNKEMAIIIVDHDLDMITNFAKEVACVNKCNTHSIRYHSVTANKILDICHV